MTIHLFEAKGWKVIPFNEYYDTLVDDIVISSVSLNGIFIKNHVEDISDLHTTILSSDESPTHAKRYNKNGRTAFTLGRIVIYHDFMLLAFSHFNEQNEAHISKPDYERCLLTMWKEIRRTYSNRPIFLPLIGSGITSFDDVPEKSNLDLLKCILCTLRASGETINQPITILLTKEMMKEINVYEAKGVVY